MDVLALFGWRTCRETPFKNSFSSASLPTRRSRAAMRASYSASTSAAAVSLSSPPASNLATQILIRLRPIPWRLARACSDSPPRNSWTTWRLNSIECVRCLAMGFLLESPVQLADSHLPHLSTPRGALQRYGTSQTSGNVQLESAKRAKTDVDQIAVANRDLRTHLGIFGTKIFLRYQQSI